MTLPCARFAAVVETPAHHDPDVQRAYVHEQLRAVVIGAAPWTKPLRVLVRGFPAAASPEAFVARARVASDPLTGAVLDVEVHFEDTATARPHRMRAYAPKSRRSPHIRLACVVCGARAEVANLPDETVPLMGRDGVLRMVPVLSDAIEPFDPTAHYTFEAVGNVLWPGPEVTQ